MEFRSWLIETSKEQIATLSIFEDRKYMSLMGFGKNADKEIQRALATGKVKAVPTPYLVWVMDNATGYQAMAKKPEIEGELHLRAQQGDRHAGDWVATQGGAAPQPQPAAPQPAQAPQPAAQGPRPGQDDRTWFLVKSKTTGVPAAVRRANATEWEFLTIDGKQGTIAHAKIGGAVDKVEDPETGGYISGPDPYELMRGWDKKMGGELSAAAAEAENGGAEAPAADQPAAEDPSEPRERKSGIIKTPSEEQQATDERFGRILASGEQSHTVLGADPGSGKTAMLNHLAWKYNAEDTGQKWLYLVFNTKNGVEAKQKFPHHAGMEIMTTNVFLGDLLSRPENLNRIPQTERIAQKFSGGKRESRPPEKIKFLADGPEFEGLMETQWHVMGLEFERREKRGIYSGDKWAKKLGEAVKRKLRGWGSIQARFKKYTVDLANLGKAYALDPRQGDIKPKLKDILEDHHGTIDTSLLEIKEDLQRMNPRWADQITDELYDILGYDFMSKDYTEEMCEAAEWLLAKSLPYETQQRHAHKGREHDLGSLRDFSDDAWFAITHADQLVWPHYDVVMADECQDFNQARIIMLKKLHEAGAKIVAVGDEKQSLYRFIGADDALTKIKEMLSGLSEDPNVDQTLTKNFRSRRAVLDGVEQETGVHLNHARIYKPGDEWEGDFTKFDIGFEDANKSIAEERQQGIQKQTAFISRTNAPLVHTALGLLAQGVPFLIIGKDVAGDLMNHINRFLEKTNYIDPELLGMSSMGGRKAEIRLSPNSPAILPEELSSSEEEEVARPQATPRPQPQLSLYKVLDAYLTDQTNTHGGKTTKAAFLEDTKMTTEAMKSAILSFAQESGGGNMSIAAFQMWLTKKLTGATLELDSKDEKEAEAAFLKYQKEMEELNPVILVTAHKSKGLEFGRVFILRYDQFPHPRAVRSGNEKDLKQEENAKFVALSRGMDEVHILDLEGQPGYEPKEKMDAGYDEPDYRYMGAEFDPRQLWSRYVENRQNQERWQRRKAKHTKDQRHGKQGMVGGNPRYSGKQGWGSTQQPNNFRTKQRDENDN